MSVQEFDKGSVPASKTGGRNVHDSDENRDARFGASRIKPPNGRRNSSQSKSEDSKSAEGEKLLLDKHIEERKRKNAERKAAVEERRNQKEQEDNAKNQTFRHLLEHRPSSKTAGRKLPSVPSNGAAGVGSRRETPEARRISSSSSSSEGHTPPPGSGKGSRNTRRSLTGPMSASTSSLNSFGSTGKPKSNLGASKKASTSTSCLNDKSSGAKTGQRTKGAGATTARRSVGSSIPKAQSMGAIHQVGHSKSSRPPSGRKPKPKAAKPTHHAGTSSEAEAGKALAEHRKKMREEAERKALLDKEKQEELRRQREEEEKRLAEENAKEMARQAELAAQLQKQQDERAKVLREQREKEAEIEAEKHAADLKRKEELEALKRQELERRVAELERREKKEEERLRKEELERQERRKRVEMIMSRTRMTSTVNSNNMTKAESYSSLEDLSLKLSDECHSNTVSEILQKVKEKSRASPSPEKDEEEYKENQQFLENSEKDSTDGKNEISNDVLRAIDNSKHGIDVGDNVEVTQCTPRDSGCNFVDNGCTSMDFKGNNFRSGISRSFHNTSNTIYDSALRNTSCTLRDTPDTTGDICSTLKSVTNGTSIDTNCTPRVVNGTSMIIGGTSKDVYNTSNGSRGTSVDYNDGTLRYVESKNSACAVNTSAATLPDVSDSHKGTKHDAELWTNVENAMLSADNKVRENLERNGVSAHEDLDNDEESEEGQLWTVVEGRRHISEVI